MTKSGPDIARYNSAKSLYNTHLIFKSVVAVRMSRSGRSSEEASPQALYAMVQPGMEALAADEVSRDLGATVKKTARGLVVFSMNQVTPKVLQLRTTEDVFLLAWGSDSLTYRPPDLDNFRKWTANRPDWPSLFKIHHALRPKTKGKPTFHLVCQLQGEHGYRRVDARQALTAGLGKHIPSSWYTADENAWLEIWLTIRSKTAVCGLRLSDRTMRHRTYKDDHILASLRPSVAGGMVRAAGIGPGMVVVDPMCGAGTILAETVEVAKRRKGERVEVVGGDIDPNAVFVSSQNMDKVGPVQLARWDSRRLPLGNESVDRIISNPPFGKQLASVDEIPPLYAACASEWNRVLKPGGRAVLLVMEQDALKVPLTSHHWKPLRLFKVRVQGQLAIMSVWQKPD
jgi:tRNA (guanine6-N2)-methyltransferase